MNLPQYALPDWLNVSRETSERLHQFCALVLHWNKAVNLISKSSVAQVWERHLLDSAQAYELAPTNSKTWDDLGSGGGFPGLVIAIMAKEKNPALEVVLIESDARKSVFLTEASRALHLNTHVLNARIEEVSPLNSDVVSARALAPLNSLCGLASRHLRPEGTALFLKGGAYGAEIAEARLQWNFKIDVRVSKTDAQSAVLVMKGITHV